MTEDTIDIMKLRFLDIPVTNATFKQNYTLVEDPLKNVTWQCKLESNPVGKITWYLNGSVISSNGFHITETVLSNTSSGVVLHSELTMIGITRHKTGHLICNASNAVGSEIATTIVIVHCKYFTLEQLNSDQCSIES